LETPCASPQSAALLVHGLTKRYGSVVAVDGIDLSVPAGEIYGFLGVNGAGKTTTIRMLMGIITSDQGNIRLVGLDARRTTVRQKRRIGYVSQEQNFYPWMTCKALGQFVGSFYPSWDRQEFDRLLGLFELPQARRVSQLSGGMKTKLSLALALAPRPELLILDEPTAGLDPVARREFMELIVDQARKYQRTTFFSSHLIDEVERCADRIGIIDRGKMRFEGKLRDLLASVRQISHSTSIEAPDLPESFVLWKERFDNETVHRVYRSEASEWNQLSHSLPSVYQMASLTLEEVFLACVGKKRIAI